ncbi:MAG: 30S ribosome-binding factor RbfA [Bacteroidetes bacterium]|nr:30S ribosome-binding factor RbfA [Bacteroidota bacterium]
MSVRQEKFAGLVQQHLAEIFQRNPELVGKQFVTISKVEVSPDLGVAKVFLSLFSKTRRTELMNLIQLNNREIRKALATKIRNQARIVPELTFIEDDSLDYVFKMEEVLKKVHAEDERKKQDKPKED